MSFQFNLGADLAELVTRIFSSPMGKSITDIYIQPGLPFRARIAGQEWVEVHDPQKEGTPEENKPIVYSEDRFDAAMAAFFAKEELKPNNAWRDEVRNSGGCAYPVFNMDAVELVTQGDNLVPVERAYRIRGTLQSQNMGSYGLMLRCLREVPASLESIGLPPTVENLLMQRSGLILVTGPTGHGKSTSIAAMVNLINSTRTANIVTIEDPVEYKHEPKLGVVTNREIGQDVQSYEKGVEQALRFVPDVIVIGEIRDPATMRAAVRAGESGHLVIATLHAPTTVAAVRKVLGYLETDGEKIAFSGCLVGVLAQALIPKTDGGKALAYEMLDCRLGADDQKNKTTVQSTIGEVVAGQGEAALAKLESELRAGKGGGPLSSHFSVSLGQLVREGLVDATRAAAVAHDRQTTIDLINMGKSLAAAKKG